MAVVGEDAKKVLEKSFGLSLSQVCGFTSDEENTFVKAKTGNPLYFSKNYDSRKIGRGNPLLARRKITTIEEINSKIDALQN